MVTPWIFTAFIILLAVQRYFELGLSRRNEAIIRSVGGREHAAWQVHVMKVLHAGWFLAMLAEVHGLRRPFLPAFALPALFIFIAGQSLRYAALLTLKWRWTIRLMTIPGLPPVRNGIYRHIRHPNYLGVVLELLAVPLLHSAYVTAVVFSIANFALLSARIRAENRALHEAMSIPPLGGWN